MNSGWSMILAQAASGPAARQEMPQQVLFFGFLLFLGVFYFMLFRNRSQERTKYEQLLKSLKRNDRVLTIGGIIGTIVDIREAEGEVTLKVDETSNVKIRFKRDAIKTVLRETPDTK
ncbi:MAG: preprotein translocase subunit YajC [Phycisphaerae bacterium]|nr:preprotein translocase subunit YajC [Phycisphaerae bacterium]